MSNLRIEDVWRCGVDCGAQTDIARLSLVEANIEPEPGYSRNATIEEIADEAAAAAGVEPETIIEAVHLAQSWSGDWSWAFWASCKAADPSIYFPERGQRVNAAQDNKCDSCAVQAECLSAAIVYNETHGRWGGTVPEHRRDLRHLLRLHGILGRIGEGRRLVWCEPGADVEPPERSQCAHPVAQKRAHQRRAVDAVVASLKDGGRGQIEMATASGKTLVGVWSARELGCSTILVLVPNLELVSQTVSVWRTNWGSELSTVVVASDSGELDAPTSTDPTEIAALVAEAGEDGRTVLVLGTYQSSRAIADSGVTFDLAIADEAHRLVGDADKAFAAIVRGEIAALRVLFMTATRKQVSTKTQSDVIGMDHPAFGPVLFTYGLDEAIDDKVVADYRVVVGAVSAADFEAVAAQIGNNVDPHLLAGAIAYVRAAERYGLASCVSFHSRVKRAATFAELVGKVAELLAPHQRPSGPGFAAWLDGDTSLSIRDRLLRRLADPPGWGLLANARALGEGVDLPALDAVAIIDPKSSESDIIQAVGRALRISGAKKVGTVLLPVLLHDKNDPADALAGVNPKSLDIVTNALRALAAHDQAFAKAMSAVRRDMASVDHSNVHDPALAALRRRAAAVFGNSRIDFDLPAGSTDRLAEGIALEVVREATSSWEERYGLLLNWVHDNETAEVPSSVLVDTPDGPFGLGAWVSNQRGLHRRSMLSSDRVIALQALPGWTWDPNLNAWHIAFAALVAFTDKHSGRFPIHREHVVDGTDIAAWVARQRDAIAAGTLDAARSARLTALPGWSLVARTYYDTWEARLSLLKRWMDDNANRKVPQSTRVTDAAGRSFHLGAWCSAQRRAQKAEKLPRDRVAALEAVPGWSWSPGQSSWMDSLDTLRSYLAAHDNIYPKQKCIFAGVRLGIFVNTCRTAYKASKLSAAQVQYLKSLPGWSWSPYDDAWNRYFEAMRAYAELAGHSSPAPGEATVEATDLNRWVTKQRSALRRGTLPTERATLLTSLPGWVDDPLEAAWQGGYRHLKAWMAEHDGRVPPQGSTCPDGFALGTWVMVQLTRYRREQLEPSRAEALCRLPGWSFPEVKRSMTFDDWVGLVRQFLAEFGHARVPKKHIVSNRTLGSWVSRIRRSYCAGDLTDTEIEALEALQGWTWDPMGDDLDTKLAALDAFVSRLGHSRVPERHVEAGIALGVWINSLRSRRARVGAELAQRLEALPEWSWNPFVDDWEDGFAALGNYVDEAGSADPASDALNADGYRIGQWVSVQRVTFKKGTLSPERAERLEALPGWTWDRNDAKWEKHFAALAAYAERTGSATPRTGYCEGPLLLGQWVAVQKRSWRNEEMRAERAERLEALPGWKWPQRNQANPEAVERGAALRRERCARALTLKQFSALLGIAATTLNDYERARLTAPATLVGKAQSVGLMAA